MRIEYINPFIDSAINVLSTYTGCPVKRGTMELRRSSSINRDVAAVVGMAGEVEGRVILEMDQDTALNVAGVMNQESFPELNALALDTLMELANLVVAKAVTVLNDKGFAFKLSPPIVFTGANLSTSSLNLETLVIPLRGNAGEIRLDIALRMNRL